MVGAHVRHCLFVPYPWRPPLFACRGLVGFKMEGQGVWNVILGFVLFTAFSFLTYQTSGMFYWVMAAFCLFSKDRLNPVSLRHRMIDFFGIGISTMLFYAVILKVFCQPHYSRYLTGLYDPYAWTTDYWGKLVWFIHVPLYNAVNLWNILPSQHGVG